MAASYTRLDELDPLPYTAEWPSLRSAWGRVDIHSLAAFWIQESQLEGHYLEFGVASGRSAVAAIRANQRLTPRRIHRYFLFDSFVGLPELEGPDAGSTQFKRGDYAFSVDEVVARLQKHGVADDSEIILVPGFFEDSLLPFDAGQFLGERAAIVHVDVDLHGSAAQVLTFITPHLQAGTILLFDDWNCFGAKNDRGERRAVREWLAANPQLRLESYAKYGWHGEAFVVDL
jgi:O-methyltransferase